MKLNVKALALACGLVLGFTIFFVTWWLIMLHGVTGTKTVIGTVYLGYNISPLGSLIGLAWGFVDGLIFGALIALVYNRLSRN